MNTSGAKPTVPSSRTEKLPLEKTLYGLQEGIAILDKAGKVVFINESGKKIFEKGLGKHPTVGDQYIDYVRTNRKKLTLRYIKDALKGLPHYFDLRYPQGKQVSWFRLGYYPIGSEDRITHVCVKAQEITDKVRLKKQLGNQKKGEKDRLENAVTEAQESERLRIGRELHDDVNQVLVTVKLYLEMCMTEEKTNKVVLQKAVQKINYSITEIRRLSHQLSSPQLSGLELAVQLQELCDSIATTQNLGVHFLCYGINDKALSAETKVTLYRIAQEQLSNVLKHSKASSVELMVVGSSETIALRITDNGEGADLSKQKVGVGLMSMRSRAEALNGTLSFESSPGKGFQLMVEIPLT